MLFVRQSWMDTNAYSRIIIMSLELSINIIIIIINEDNLNAVNIRCYKTCNGNPWRHYLLVLILVSCFHQEEKLYVVEEKGETKEKCMALQNIGNWLQNEMLLCAIFDLVFDILPLRNVKRKVYKKYIGQ